MQVAQTSTNLNLGENLGRVCACTSDQQTYSNQEKTSWCETINFTFSAGRRTKIRNPKSACRLSPSDEGTAMCDVV